MADELNLSRQAKLVPVDKINEYTIKIFGVGSIGSHVAKVMAKTGFKNIEVFDMDIVEEENLAAQAFDFKHIKKNKVDAIAEIIKDGTNIEIVTNNGQITKDFQIDAESNTIYCCFFDSIEGRKLIFDKLKDMPIIFVDARIGMYDMRHYLIDCSDKAEVENYAKTLEIKATSELQCGEKACAPINVQLAGMITMNIVNFIMDKDYTKTFIGNAATPNNHINVLKIMNDK